MAIAEIVNRATTEQLGIQIDLADRVRFLSNEAQYIESRSEDLLANERQAAKERGDKEKARLKTLFDQRLQQLQGLKNGTPPGPTARSQATPDAAPHHQEQTTPVLSLPMRLGHFFGQS